MSAHILEPEPEEELVSTHLQGRQLPIAYLVKTTIYVATILLLSRQAQETGQLWLALLTACLITIPPLLTLLYTSTIRTIHQSSIFVSRGFIRRLFTRRLLKSIGSTCFAMAFGLLSVFWLSALKWWEIMLLFGAIPLLILIYRGVEGPTKREIREYAAHAYSLAITRRLLTIVLTAGLLIHPLFLADSGDSGELAPAIELISATPLDVEKSYLVQVSSRLFRHIQALSDYAAQSAFHVQFLYAAIVIATNLSLAFHFTLLISAFAIPTAEFRRVFGDISDAAVPPQVPATKSAFISAMAVLTVFILLPVFQQIELRLRQEVALREVVSSAERKLVTFAEQIDELLYTRGTIEEITEARIVAALKQGAAVENVRLQARRSFAAMRRNVDGYLDWYYSLPAEYLRVVGALTGNIEQVIRRDLEKALAKGQPFAALDTAVASALSDRTQTLDSFEEQRDEILASNRITRPSEDIFIVQVATLQEVLTPPQNAVLVNLDQRLAASGVGAVTAVIAAKVVGKVAAKGSIKLAASAMAKAGTTKLVGTSGGAAAGAALGSVFPGMGTLLGGIVGAAVGLATGVSVDALLLKLESYYSRDDFRNHIVGAINEQEREFLSLLEERGDG